MRKNRPPVRVLPLYQMVARLRFCGRWLSRARRFDQFDERLGMVHRLIRLEIVTFRIG